MRQEQINTLETHRMRPNIDGDVMLQSFRSLPGSMKSIDAELMQKRLPVGLGPSPKTWPWDETKGCKYFGFVMQSSKSFQSKPRSDSNRMTCDINSPKCALH